MIDLFFFFPASSSLQLISGGAMCIKICYLETVYFLPGMDFDLDFEDLIYGSCLLQGWNIFQNNQKNVCCWTYLLSIWLEVSFVMYFFNEENTDMFHVCLPVYFESLGIY